MFKKYRNNPYVRACVAVVICGALLIVFSNWIEGNRITKGLQFVNKTLTPVYIGMIFAFILCPVYNACVKFLYARMLKGASKAGFSVGPSPVKDEDKPTYDVSANEKHRLFTFARALSTIICVVLVVGLVSMLAYFVLPQLIQSVMGLVNTLPGQLEAFAAWAQSHADRFPKLAESVSGLTDLTSGDLMSWLDSHVIGGNMADFASKISSGVLSAVKTVLNVIIGLLIMIYLLNYKERLFAMMRKFVAATCSKKTQDNLFEFAAIVNKTFIGFIVGRLIDSFIIGVLTYIVLSIVGIDLALMISVIIGVTNIIPFFGPFIGAIPSAFILLLEDPIQAVYFLVIIVLIQQLDGNVIGPRVVGNAIGISSFWVLIAVLVGGGLFGFAGMALGVPVVAVIGTYLDKLTTNSLVAKNEPSGTDDYFNLDPYNIVDEDMLKEPEKKPKEKKFQFGFKKKDKQDE